VRSDRLTLAQLRARIAPLVQRARTELRAEGFSGSRQIIQQLVDVRYVGQSYEISVPFAADYRDEFDRRHSRMYGYSDPARPTEVVHVRVVASGVTDKPVLPFSRPGRRPRLKPKATRPGRFDGRTTRVAFYHWSDLLPGSRASGPAVITGGEATIVVPPRFRFQVDGFGNVVVRR
jgi:N-methylhydantoinase A/oxoprolinase/acetone carboxylase beta subunit